MSIYINTLVKQLEELPDLAENSKVDQYSEYLNKELATYLLDLALNDTNYFSYILQRSYKHSLDVLKIVLLKSDLKDRELRLHIWRDKGENCLTHYDKHDHKWSFASCVLSGIFTHDVYGQREIKSPLSSKYIFKKLGTNNTNSITCFSGLDVEQVLSTRMLPGTIYLMYHNAVHKIYVNCEIGITLMIRFKYVKEETVVYSSRSINLDSQEQGPKKFSRSELNGVLEDTIMHLITEQ